MTSKPWRILSVHGDSVRVAWRGGLTIDVRVDRGTMVKPHEVYILPRHHATLVDDVVTAWRAVNTKSKTFS